MAVHRAPQTSGRLQRRLLIFIPPAIILIFVLALVFTADTEDAGLERDADLCPLADADISARAVFLVDLVKPLDDGRQGLPGELLRSLTLGLDANAELRVFTLAQDAAAPRHLLGRLCKPYNNADLAFAGAKDQSGEVPDCGDLPAQLPQNLRSNATQFCARRNALSERLDQIGERRGAGPVDNAHLIEALEETSLEFAELPGPRALFVFSDMMQHTYWYSHPELGWNGWSFGRFLDWRQAQDALVGPRPAPIGETDVTIFYTPRDALTAQLRIKAVHKGFWRDYFADAVGAEPNFQDQPAMAAYQVIPLMSPTSEGQLAELAEEERLRLRQEQEEAERALAQVEQEQAALAEARQRAEEEERQQAARIAELRRQQEALAAREAAARQAAAERAEQERLRQQRQEAERLAQAERERAAQEEARRRAEAEAREREAREAERRRQQEALAAQEAEQRRQQEALAAQEAERERARAAAERAAAEAAERQAAAEQAEQERLRQQRQEAERLAQAEQERAAQEEARRRAEAEARELEAREAERRRQQEALAAQEAERERARAAAELAAAEAAERQAAAERAEQERLRQQRQEDERLAQAERERAAEAAAESAQSADEPQPAPLADLPNCAVRLKNQFLNAGDIYPGRREVNYGNAVMVVMYALDEQGRTVDDGVLIDRERSTVTVNRHFDKFAEEAQNLVRTWEFVFEDAEDSTCNKHMELRSQFHFNYR